MLSTLTPACLQEMKRGNQPPINMVTRRYLKFARGLQPKDKVVFFLNTIVSCGKMFLGNRVFLQNTGGLW